MKILISLSLIVGLMIFVGADTTEASKISLLQTLQRFSLCSRLLNLRPALQSTPINFTHFHYQNDKEQLLVTSAFWLREYVDSNPVNFAKTHLSGLVPLVNSIRTNIEEAVAPGILNKKSDADPDAIERTIPFINDVLREIDEHLIGNGVTYNWLLSLAFRATYLLDFESIGIWGKLVKYNKAQQLATNSRNFQRWVTISKRFSIIRRPNSPNLGSPGFGNFSRAAINHMMALGFGLCKWQLSARWPTDIFKHPPTLFSTI